MKNQINYGVTGSDRQQLVGIISRELGIKPVYTRMPECAYAVDNVKITKEGAVEWDERTDNATIQRLVDALAVAGFEPTEPVHLTSEPEGQSEEPQTAEETATEGGLTISLPLDGFSPKKLELLQKLVDSKASLIKKATAADRLTIRINEDKVEFPWWDTLPTPEETQAYMAFIAALCAKAKEARRVNASDHEVESEKFAFRVFLMSLGFKGSDSKQIRNVLLKRLTGPAAFPTQAAADGFSAKQKAKRDTAKAADDADGLRRAEITMAVSRIAGEVSAMGQGT
ncbi:MAG: virulence protein [Oscillospiraceae bacterium]|nr:virulence protein [Oscillospiraceae bacterium]